MVSSSVLAFAACLVFGIGFPVPGGLDTCTVPQTAGQYKEASTPAAQTRESPESVRAAIASSLAAGRLDTALSSYERLVAITGQTDVRVLADISRLVLDRGRRDEDPLARVESCRALLRAGNSPCAAELRETADNPKLAPRVRLTAAAGLAEKDRAGILLLQGVAEGITGSSQTIVADVAGGLPAAIAVPIVSGLLDSPVPEVQIVAATVLGQFDTPAAKAALKALAAREPRAPGRGAAVMSLARLGDAERLRALAAVLDRLEGADLYRLGSGLAAAGDPRGMRLLEEALTDRDALVRVEAAAAMARFSSEKAHAAIEDVLRSGNLGERAYALEIVGRLGWSPSREMWKLLNDANPVVRVRAAAICTAAGARVATS